MLQLVPFVLVLGIFYFIILLPMQRKQQKVQEFLDSLKVERPGHHDRRHLRPDHAARRAERAAADRRQGADRSVEGGHRRLSGPGAGRRDRRANPSERTICTNLRWKVITILAVFVIFFGRRRLSDRRRALRHHSPGWLMDKQLKLGLDLKGGVHLVLRVQTDDALRLETEQEMERLRDELQTQEHHRSTSIAARRSDGVPGRGRAAGAGRGVPRSAANEVQTNFDRGSGVERHLHVHDEAEHRS